MVAQSIEARAYLYPNGMIMMEDPEYKAFEEALEREFAHEEVSVSGFGSGLMY